MREHYFINPKKGIYYTRSAYHDDVDYIYVVDFDKPDVDKQFRAWQDRLIEEGKKEGLSELKNQFRSLRVLLS